MARRAHAHCLRRWPGLVLGLLTLAFGYAPLCAQMTLTLDQLGFRKKPDYGATYAGQKVTVHGVVSAPSYHFLDHTVLPIQDARSGGVLLVPANDKWLDRFRPGDEVDAVGKVSMQAGMTVVLPESIVATGHEPPPEPDEVPLADLDGFRYLGRLVRTEGLIAEPGYNTGGAYVNLALRRGIYKVFIPQSSGHSRASVESFHSGDRVRVTGIAFQYCPTQPYNRLFELLVGDAASVVPIPAERSWGVEPPVVAAGLGAALLVGFLLWNRERRARFQRRRLRRTYQLGEEILGASSAETVLKHISVALPGILGVTRVQLYVYNRTAKTLDAVTGESGEPASISLSSPPGGTPAGAVACFHYRTLLVIPDIERSPFPLTGAKGERSPKSLLFVPMLAQNEMIGVLELDQDDRVRDFTSDEQALAQHLGNQIGVSIRLLDQRTVQEQLFRTEKLAAIGRLISGVVNELQTPLASITELAHKASDKARGGPAEREVSAIADEAEKANGIVTRLVSFAGAEQGETRPVEITALLRRLIEFREGDWKASGIRVRDLTTRDPLFVLGSQGQLEQVFLNLFVHAEQSLAESEQKSITIRTSRLARRLLVEISFTSPAELRKPEDTAAVLSVTRSVIAGHGGEIRLIEKTNADPRFEVELPASMKERAAASPGGRARDTSRRMTVLVIEPDDGVQRQLLALLSTRGCRVVPVTNSDTGLDLASRMRFDAAFCSIHAPGLNWVELSERMYSRVGGFILLSDGYDAELAADFEGEARFVLPKPLQEAELDRVLRLIEPPSATVISITA
jgi:GAF domain-containing protein/CheY-like chemotaxis protein